MAEIVQEQYKYSDLTAKIIGAAMEAHSRLGTGYQEVIYQRAMAIELAETALSFQRECEMPICYRNINIGSRRVDFLVEGTICVELKALARLEPAHFAQAINYLEAFNLEVGLLLNFGSTRLEFKRFTNKKFNSNL